LLCEQKQTLRLRMAQCRVGSLQAPAEKGVNSTPPPSHRKKSGWEFLLCCQMRTWGEKEKGEKKKNGFRKTVKGGASDHFQFSARTDPEGGLAEGGVARGQGGEKMGRDPRVVGRPGGSSRNL